MKPIHVTSDSYVEYSEDSNKNEPKLVVVLEYQNTKTFLLRDASKLV